jgi:hypothetical protein
MTIYMSKVWGFSVPVGPLQFGTVGWRDRSRFELLKPGDRVVLVGTMGPPTEEKNYGRLLGMMEPTLEPVYSRDYDLRNWAQDYDDGGNYRWPYALRNLHAWRFVDPPRLQDISSRRFGMDAVTGIVPLTDEEAEKVMWENLEPVELLPPAAQARQRVERGGLSSRRISPPPQSIRQGVMYLRNSPAFTYVMAITGKACGLEAYKIGWAFDVALRARQFNQAAMPELGGLAYRIKLTHLWETAREAFAMEQRLLRFFDDQRHGSNHEVVYDVRGAKLEEIFVRFSR